MYNDLYSPLLYYTEYFYYLKGLRCSAYLSMPPPPPQHPTLATTDLFTASIVSPFPQRRVVEIIYYSAFSDGLRSLSNAHLSFFPIFSWLVLISFSTE